MALSTKKVPDPYNRPTTGDSLHMSMVLLKVFSCWVFVKHLETILIVTDAP